MKPTVIKDNGKYEEKVLSEIPNLCKLIANKTLGQLQEEGGIFVFPKAAADSEDHKKDKMISDDLEKDQMILKRVDGEYSTGNVMGFLGLGEERLVIASRFSDTENGNEDYFLWYILAKTLDSPSILDLKTDAAFDERVFDYITLMFPHYLKRAMRKGLFKVYVRRKYNDDSIKGSLDIDRHIKLNTPFMGSAAYSMREFSYDNDLSELVRHAIEFIKRKAYGSQLLLTVKDEVKRIVEVTPEYRFYDRQRVIERNKRAPIGHAYYSEYYDLQKLCIMLLTYQMIKIASSSNRIYGILFDGTWLWEEYVNLLVGEYFHHPKNKRKSGGQELFTPENGSVTDKGSIYPDFIGRHTSDRIIADAKYKPRDNIGRDDYFQLLAYMFRFDAKKGFYFYPDNMDKDESNSTGKTELKLWLNRGSTFDKVEKRNDTYLCKLGLKIPSGSNSYEEFKSEMEKREKAFKNAFKDAVSDLLEK